MFEVKGSFVGHNITDKQGQNGAYSVGDAIFWIDRSYEYKGERVDKILKVPFRALGKAAQRVLELKEGAEVNIRFDISGRDWQGRSYSELKLISVSAASEEMPF